MTEDMAQAVLTKELDSAGYAIVARLRDLRDELKGLRALEVQAKEELRAYLGVATTGLMNGEPVVRVDQVWRESFDLERAQNDPVYTQMLAACTKVSEYVTVRLV